MFIVTAVRGVPRNRDPLGLLFHTHHLVGGVKYNNINPRCPAARNALEPYFGGISQTSKKYQWFAHPTYGSDLQNKAPAYNGVGSCSYSYYNIFD